MSKGLEALEECKAVLISNPDTKRYYDIFEKALLDTIEKELKKAELFDFICYLILKDSGDSDYAIVLVEKIKRLLMKYPDLVKEVLL